MIELKVKKREKEKGTQRVITVRENPLSSNILREMYLATGIWSKSWISPEMCVQPGHIPVCGWVWGGVVFEILLTAVMMRISAQFFTFLPLIFDT